MCLNKLLSLLLLKYHTCHIFGRVGFFLPMCPWLCVPISLHMYFLFSLMESTCKWYRLVYICHLLPAQPFIKFLCLSANFSILLLQVSPNQETLYAWVRLTEERIRKGDKDNFNLSCSWKIQWNITENASEKIHL